MQENPQYSFKNDKAPRYDKPKVLVGLILALALLVHFSILGVLASLYTSPGYRSFWWFPALLGVLCLFLVVRLCLHLYRNHLSRPIDG